jgi:hypothetical protein
MKRNFSKTSNRDKIDKLEKKASIAGALTKEKGTKKRFSIYDDFEDEEVDDLDPKFLKKMKSKH